LLDALSHHFANKENHMQHNKTWKIGVILALALGLSATSAWADRDETHNYYGDTNTYAQGGDGGKGGDGGDGGTGLGIGIGMGGEGGTGIGIGGTGIGQGGNGVGVGGNSKSDADANAAAGAKATGGNSGGNSLAVIEGDYEARAIPVGSSIAAGANATTKCAQHKSKSFNLFFASFAASGHEPDYMCWANEMGHAAVAVQMACNESGAFRKAFNQVARKNGTEECLSE
jgi:hypothetical protein